MVSKNGVSLIILVLSILGVEASDTEIMTTLSVIAQVVSLIVMAWNQYSREDIQGFFFKKTE
jgi:hypothetical protein